MRYDEKSMNPKKQIVALGIISLIVLAAGYYIAKVYECGNSLFCNFLYFRVGDALLYGMGALVIVFIVLYLVPQAYGTWKKFAIWFVPLAALVFIFTPEPQGFDLLTPYPEQVFQWVSVLYVLVSLAIIGWVAFGSKNNS